MAPALARVPEGMLFLALLGLSLVLIFAGSTLAEAVAFLVVGFLGAMVGGTLAIQYLSPGWGILGIILGFVLGGLLGLALIPLGIGFAVGYAGYLLALDFALSTAMALIAGIAFFLVGMALSGRILTVVTAAVGGLLLFNVLTYYGFGPTMATLVAAVMTIIGLWVQMAPGRRMTQPTASNVGGQPSDHR